jgi:hypothetical protein
MLKTGAGADVTSHRPSTTPIGGGGVCLLHHASLHSTPKDMLPGALAMIYVPHDPVSMLSGPPWYVPMQAVAPNCGVPFSIQHLFDPPETRQTLAASCRATAA